MILEEFETSRLQIRRFKSDDEDAFFAMMGDPEVMRLYGGGVCLPHDSALEALNHHLNCREHQYWAWAVTAKEDGRFIGSLTAGITDFEGEKWFEPAWIFARKEWGKGFATEAARGVVDYALSRLQWSRAIATAHPQNLASIRVIEKAGFTFLREAEVRVGRTAKVFVINS